MNIREKAKILWQQYKWPLTTGVTIIIIFFIIPIFYKNYIVIKELYPAITATGGLLLSVPIKLFWESYRKPILRIREDVKLRSYKMPKRYNLLYYINMIVVENVGRSAATNCKGYIIDERMKEKERVCWTLPAERPNAIINANDEEKLDFCAILTSSTEMYSKIIAPTETGWDNYRDLDYGDVKVLITADNTEPVIKKVKFNLKLCKIEIRN